MTHAPLQFRTPQTTWMIAAVVLALCLHGACWFIAKLWLGGDDALATTQRQMVLSLFWMVGAIAIWRVAPPASRLHAYVTAMACALFVSVLGSGVVLIKLIFVDKYEPNGNFLSAVGMLGGVVMFSHFASALLSAALLQGVALTQKKAE